MNFLLPLVVALPLGSGFLLALLPGRFLKFANFFSVLIATVLLLSALLLLPTSGYYEIGGWIFPLGINFSFDGLSRLLLLMVAVVGFTVTIYSASYMDLYTSRIRFFALFLLLWAGLNGTLLSGDIFNRYVYVEIAVIASYILVGFGCAPRELKAALKYAILGAVASAFTLLGIAVVYSFAGTVNIAQLAGRFAALPEPVFLGSPAFFAGVLMVLGFGYKSAQAPLHVWQPDAFAVAPAPVAALMSSSLVVVVGLYAMIRTVFTVFGVVASLCWLMIFIGVLSLVLGLFYSARTDHPRRVLSYQSISQIGYVFTALGLAGVVFSRGISFNLSIWLLVGGLYHLLNHAFFISSLFLALGAAEFNTIDVDCCSTGRGIFVGLPLVGGVSTLASASAAGLPPFGGFISKLIIVVATWYAGFPFIALLLILISLGAIPVFYRFNRRALQSEPSSTRRPPTFLMKSAMVFLVVLVISASFLILPPLRSVYLEPAAFSLLDERPYEEKIGEWENRVGDVKEAFRTRREEKP